MSLQRVPHYRYIPYQRNPYFTGREQLLTKLAKALQEGQSTALSQTNAISGLGGIGKTQIALEYAYRYQQDYQAVFWVQADTREAIISGFVTVAGLLNLSEKDAPEQMIAVKAVQEWMKTQMKWLLILDNADDLTMVREFIPPVFGGHLLLTTRAQTMGRLAHKIEVEDMDSQQGALFLLRRSGLIGPDTPLEQALPANIAIAKELSEAMGGLPLALDQAGAYIEETQSSLADYRSLYRTRRVELLRKRGGLVLDHPEPVATTWSLALEKAEETNAAAISLLQLCAFLHPDAIPEEIITKGVEHLSPQLRVAANDPMAFNEAIKILRDYSLIHRDSDAHTLSIHRLVQAVLKDTMDEQTTRQLAEQTVQVVNAAFPHVEAATWPLCELLLPHALICVPLIEQYHITTSEAARLLNQAGYYLYERGQYTDAESLLQQALSIREQTLEPTHVDVMNSLNDLALLYQAQGKYPQAEPLQQRVLSISEQVLGPNHIGVASSLNNLALLYQKQGKHGQAERLFERALSIREQALDPLHLEVANSLHNLASLYAVQSKYEQAERLFERALSIREQALDPLHPNVANTLNKLAAVYRAQGRYEQAEYLYQRAFSIRDYALGPNHPDLATTLNDLAQLYKAQGKYVQAEAFHQRALSIRERLLGPSHPDVATTLNDLALLYKIQGEYIQAEVFYQRALSIREHAFGLDHPNVATSLHNLAALYRMKGKYEEAEPLYRRALVIREQALGSQHPDVAQSLNSLAVLYWSQENYTQAAPLLQRALSIREHILGPDHPDVIVILNNLAALHLAQGKYQEAAPLLQRALSLQEQVLGPDHPDVKNILNNLAALYYAQNQYTQAEPLLQRAITIVETTLGPDHPDLIDILNSYAFILRKMKRDSEAKELEARAKAIQAKKKHETA